VSACRWPSQSFGFALDAFCAKEAALLRNLLHNFRLAWKFPRWRWAILTAVLSDALGFTVVLFPPMEWLLDWDHITMVNAVNIEHTIMKTPTIFQVSSS
jgi:hypothetical protein